MRRSNPVVYRTYDATGRLLYIGSSTNVAQRMENHRAMSWWFSLAQQVVIEPHEDIASARAAEATAIRAERPIANVAHRGSDVRFDASHYTDDDFRVADEWVGHNDRAGRIAHLTRPLRRAIAARRALASTA